MENSFEELMLVKLSILVSTLAPMGTWTFLAYEQEQKNVPSLESIFAVWDELEVVRPTRVKSLGSDENDNSWREILIDGECFLDNSQRLNGRKIVGRNRQYWFELDSLAGDLTKWSLTGIGKVPLPEKFQEQWDLFGLPEVEETIRFAGYELKDFLSHPAVEIFGIRRTSKNPDVIEVSFGVSSAKANSGFRPIRVKSGVLKLSEVNQFLLVGYRMELPQGAFDLEYSNAMVHGRLSSMPEQIIIRQEGKVVQTRNFEISFEPVDPNNFRVTYFGLPEPPGLFHEYRYLNISTIFGIAIFVIAIVVAYKRYSNK